MTALKSLYRRASDAIEADTIDARADSHLSVTTVSLRWEAWEEIAKLLEGALNRMLEIKAEEDAREDASSGSRRRWDSSAFESPKLYE